MAEFLILVPIQQHKQYNFLRGLNVTGSDISKAAIDRARDAYASDNKNINFIVDDILNSKINDNNFDYVFDRGCFHVMPVEKRTSYIKEIKRILDEEGILFLKCSSRKEPQRKDLTSFQKIR
jgi:ubiquinone/menaquinone biosynthesis C-methylase UbiE